MPEDRTNIVSDPSSKSTGDEKAKGKGYGMLPLTASLFLDDMLQFTNEAFPLASAMSILSGDYHFIVRNWTTAYPDRYIPDRILNKRGSTPLFYYDSDIGINNKVIRALVNETRYQANMILNQLAAFTNMPEDLIESIKQQLKKFYGPEAANKFENEIKKHTYGKKLDLKEYRKFLEQFKELYLDDSRLQYLLDSSDKQTSKLLGGLDARLGLLSWLNVRNYARLYIKLLELKEILEQIGKGEGAVPPDADALNLIKAMIIAKYKVDNPKASEADISAKTAEIDAAFGDEAKLAQVLTKYGKELADIYSSYDKLSKFVDKLINVWTNDPFFSGLLSAYRAENRNITEILWLARDIAHVDAVFAAKNVEDAVNTYFQHSLMVGPKEFETQLDILYRILVTYPLEVAYKVNRIYPTFRIFLVHPGTGLIYSFRDFYSPKAVESIDIYRDKLGTADVCRITVSNRGGQFVTDLPAFLEPHDIIDAGGARTPLMLKPGMYLIVKLGYANLENDLRTRFIGRITDVQMQEGRIVVMAQGLGTQLLMIPGQDEDHKGEIKVKDGGILRLLGFGSIISSYGALIAHLLLQTRGLGDLGRRVSLFRRWELGYRGAVYKTHRGPVMFALSNVLNRFLHNTAHLLPFFAKKVVGVFKYSPLYYILPKRTRDNIDKIVDALPLLPTIMDSYRHYRDITHNIGALMENIYIDAGVGGASTYTGLGKYAWDILAQYFRSIFGGIGRGRSAKDIQSQQRPINSEVVPWGIEYYTRAKSLYDCLKEVAWFFPGYILYTPFYNEDFVYSARATIFIGQKTFYYRYRDDLYSRVEDGPVIKKALLEIIDDAMQNIGKLKKVDWIYRYGQLFYLFPDINSFLGTYSSSLMRSSPTTQSGKLPGYLDLVSGGRAHAVPQTVTESKGDITGEEFRVQLQDLRTLIETEGESLHKTGKNIFHLKFLFRPENYSPDVYNYVLSMKPEVALHMVSARPLQKTHFINSEEDIIANNLAANATDMHNAVAYYFPHDPFMWAPGIAVPGPDENKFDNFFMYVLDDSIPDDILTPVEFYEPNSDPNVWFDWRRSLAFKKRVKKKILEPKDLLEAFQFLPAYMMQPLNKLMEEIAKMYAGEVIIVGMPTIDPWDVVYMMDLTNDMIGLLEVEGVTEHFSVETGYVTVIHPSLFTTIDMLDKYRASVLHRVFHTVYASTLKGAILKAVLTAFGLAIFGPFIGAAAYFIGISAGFLLIPLIIYKITAGVYKTLKEHTSLMVFNAARVMLRNALSFIPVWYKGFPYVAGIQGYRRDTIEVMMLDKYRNNPVIRTFIGIDPYRLWYNQGKIDNWYIFGTFFKSLIGFYPF